MDVGLRLSDRTILVRNEEAPDGSTVVADMAAALQARGLTPLGADFPGIVLLTYTILDATVDAAAAPESVSLVRDLLG